MLTPKGDGWQLVATHKTRVLDYYVAFVGEFFVNALIAGIALLGPTRAGDNVLGCRRMFSNSATKSHDTLVALIFD